MEVCRRNGPRQGDGGDGGGVGVGKGGRTAGHWVDPDVGSKSSLLLRNSFLSLSVFPLIPPT